MDPCFKNIFSGMECLKNIFLYCATLRKYFFVINFMVRIFFCGPFKGGEYGREKRGIAGL